MGEMIKYLLDKKISFNMIKSCFFTGVILSKVLFLYGGIILDSTKIYCGCHQKITSEERYQKNFPPQIVKVDSTFYDKYPVCDIINKFVMGEDYRYFTQKHLSAVTFTDKISIYRIDNYEGVYAISIPFQEERKEGHLVTYKNLNNNKEYSIIRYKSIDKQNDTIIELSVLRNPLDVVSIIFSKGKNSINIRPGCKDDPSKPCYQKCNGFNSCMACTWDECNASNTCYWICQSSSIACAIGFAMGCSLVYLY